MDDSIFILPLSHPLTSNPKCSLPIPHPHSPLEPHKKL